MIGEDELRNRRVKAEDSNTGGFRAVSRWFYLNARCSALNAALR